jgi:hypothetical protein
MAIGRFEEFVRPTTESVRAALKEARAISARGTVRLTNRFHTEDRLEALKEKDVANGAEKGTPLEMSGRGPKVRHDQDVSDVLWLAAG